MPDRIPTKAEAEVLAWFESPATATCPSGVEVQEACVEAAWIGPRVDPHPPRGMFSYNHSWPWGAEITSDGRGTLARYREAQGAETR